MTERKTMRYEMKADESQRKGVYANVIEARSMAKESILSFFFADEAAETEAEIAMAGTMVARVVMTHDTLIELRDLLDRHIESNFGTLGEDDGE